MESISVGVDIGSAAIKVVALSQRGQLMHSAYVPHHYRVRETLRILWRQLRTKVCEGALHLAFTGKGAAEFSSALQIPFVDEVQAETEALRRFHPEVDVAVSLGGEDARRWDGNVSGTYGGVLRCGYPGVEYAGRKWDTSLSHCLPVRGLCEN